MRPRYRIRPDINFNLEYIRYPIGIAFQSLQGDLSKVENSRELRMVAKRWRLAEHKFKNDLKQLPAIIYGHPGSVSRRDEYSIYLRQAMELIVRKEQSLLKFTP